MRKTLSVLVLITLLGCVTVTDGGGSVLTATSVEKAETRIALGLGYLERGSMVKARENLEMARSHAPDYYRTQLSLAHYYETVGELKSAEKMYLRALKLQPNSGDVLNNYGTFLCKKSDFDLADHYFQTAISQPNYYRLADSYENAAFCSLKSGRIVQAKTYFEQTLYHDPNRTRTILQLAKLEIEQNEIDHARLRLFSFHQEFGVYHASLALLVRLETKAGNSSMSDKYQQQLDALTNQKL